MDVYFAALCLASMCAGSFYAYVGMGIVSTDIRGGEIEPSQEIGGIFMVISGVLLLTIGAAGWTWELLKIL